MHISAKKYPAVIWCSCALILSGSAWADWRDRAGYTTLQGELGSALPDGSGIPVMISEATVSATEFIYLPQGTTGTAPYAGTGVFAGKTITPYSGASSTSSHAATVLGNFCGTGQSLASGVTEVHAWLADDFALTLLGNDPPPSFSGSVQNHSWAGTVGNAALDIEIMRKLDLLVDRDGATVTTPLNNGGSMASLLANAYHSIAVGVFSGNHPTTHSNLDGLGRMKPDIVVDQIYTSFAAPAVASAATLLLDTIRPAFPEADDPRVVKAILIAGATKQNLPGWHRTGPTRPYDETFGAGELNVLNAYHILAEGRQATSDATTRSHRGWDMTTTSGATRRYFFEVPQGRWANTFSAAITWHRHFSDGVSTMSLADVNLRLVQASGFVPGSSVDESTSSVDNVEHIFRRNLPPGRYALEVTSTTADETFAIAWEAQLGSGPAVTVSKAGGTCTLSMNQLDPFKTYTIEASPDLVSWNPIATIRTADTTASTSAQWSEPAGGESRFYRLAWAL
ncbi:MAG: hypothetical protein JNM99_02785 [Verrucomicrobiaceae bacterium]|nr:hypothetical protein [Verrucomicrobiaceae bacterium]